MTKQVSHLILVRHGESEYNAKGLWAGWDDPKLTSKGKKEAALAASSIKDIDIHAAFTSDLARAYQTMDIILRKLGKKNIPQHRTTNLRERHYGIYTAKNKWEIKEEVGDEKFKKIRRGWDEPISLGESLKHVHDRVHAHFIAHIKPLLDKNQNILIVAHGNSTRALIKFLDQIPDESIADFELATGEVFVYKIDNKGKIIKKEKRAVNKNKGKQ